MFGISKRHNVDLDSFRTQFWLEEKKWYVTLDQWIDTFVSFLYTNPLPFMDKTLVTKSTSLQPMKFPYTEYLVFDWDLPMQKELIYHESLVSFKVNRKQNNQVLNSYTFFIAFHIYVLSA
jgi:hypothetical protein